MCKFGSVITFTVAVALSAGLLGQAEEQDIQEQIKPTFYRNQGIDRYQLNMDNIPRIQRYLKMLGQETTGTNGSLRVGKHYFDRIVVDHSQDCMHSPQDIGSCAAYWVFPSISLFEWLYCKEHGKLLRFSEQYVLDCGGFVGAGGSCHGAKVRLVTAFVNNFGLELAEHYPYTGTHLGKCPFKDKKMNLNSTGYIRFDGLEGFDVPLSKFDYYLRFGPLVVQLYYEKTGLIGYEGGIHELKGCSNEAFFEFLLVGSGVENGVEYWKLRSSWGTKWGEDGYYRMSKKHLECVVPYGISFGTYDGIDFHGDKMIHNPSYAKLPQQGAQVN